MSDRDQQQLYGVRAKQLHDLGYRLAFCRACNRREAWHRPSGECANADRHADKVCPCGRPCASDRCDECKARDEL